MDSIIENGYKFVCSLNDLKEYKGRRFIINDTEIAIFKINTNVFALSNICPHQQTTLIYDGIIEDGCVVCPVHGWMFDLKTGMKQSGSRGLESYSVIINKEEVFVKVKPKEFRW